MIGESLSDVKYFALGQGCVHSPINVPYYSKDTEIARCNQDTHATNEQGKLILDLCKSNSLRILNGGLNGDKSGKFTRTQRGLMKMLVQSIMHCAERLYCHKFSPFLFFRSPNYLITAVYALIFESTSPKRVKPLLRTRKLG